MKRFSTLSVPSTLPSYGFTYTLSRLPSRSRNTYSALRSGAVETWTDTGVAPAGIAVRAFASSVSASSRGVARGSTTSRCGYSSGSICGWKQ